MLLILERHLPQRFTEEHRKLHRLLLRWNQKVRRRRESEIRLRYLVSLCIIPLDIDHATPREAYRPLSCTLRTAKGEGFGAEGTESTLRRDGQGACRTTGDDVGIRRGRDAADLGARDGDKEPALVVETLVVLEGCRDERTRLVVILGRKGGQLGMGVVDVNTPNNWVERTCTYVGDDVRSLSPD